MLNKCHLCELEATLCQSHMIPKFVFRWLKDTSATGLIRFQKTPDQLQQDGIKPEMLCRKCEGLFNNWETKFANEIFWPYLNEKKIEFEYDEWLSKFICSVHWRIVNHGKEQGKPLPRKLQEKLEIAEYRLKEYLLGRRKFHNSYFLFMTFVDFIGQADGDVPSGLTRYLGRAIDAEVVYKKNEELWIYAKLGKIIMVTILKGQKIDAWRDGIITVGKGKIFSRQHIKSGLGNWLIIRTKQMNEKMTGKSNKHRNKFWDKIMADPEAFIKTETFKSYLEEERLTGNLPRF